ncbi:MAG: V-type ATPase subunit [Thermoplasmata archaeon]
MAASPYASSLGRLKAEGTSLLPGEGYLPFLNATTVDEFLKALGATAHAAELERARAAYAGVPLAEATLNRTLVARNRHAYEATPFAGRLTVAAYLRRWDVENIAAILASKVQRQALSVGETELVSSREIPAGLIAGPMTIDDVRALLALPGVDAIAAELVRYGYGGALLPRIEEFQRTRDIFPLLQALQAQYYAAVLETTRFFQGDEWTVRDLLRGEIDARNVLLLFKGKDAGLPFEEVGARWIPGGAIGNAEAADLYGARDVPELAERLAPRYPGLAEGSEAYAESGALSSYDLLLQRGRLAAELRRLGSYPMGLAGIFSYLLLAEAERNDLRRLLFAVVYAVPVERRRRLLVGPRAVG